MFRSSVVYTLIACSVYVILCSSLFSYVIDDAYISLRYARNLAEGYGLVFNPADAPYESYSNFLVVLVEAAAHLLGLDALMVIKLASMTAGAAVIAALQPFARCTHERASAGTVFLVQMALATSVPFVVWSVGG